MICSLRNISLALCLKRLASSLVAVGLILLLVIWQPRYDTHSHHWRVNGSHHFPFSEPTVMTNFTPTNVSRIIIAGGLSREKPGWFSQLPENMMQKYYPVRDTSSGYINKGHEAMFYLQYIIDHYETLPDFMVFVHDHHRAWHNSDVTDRSTIHLLRDLKWTYVATQGFVNLRCIGDPNCPTIEPLGGYLQVGDMKDFFEAAWKELLEPEFGPQPTLAATCCAQFVVTRDTVITKPKEFYVRAKDWIIASDGSDWQIGRVFEYTWHVIFGKPSVHCPDVDTCRFNLYGYTPDFI